MTEPSALAIDGLEKSYKSGFRRRVNVLRGLRLEVGKGEVYGLLGRNGAGKSTTFRILMGLARPDNGSICILDGKPGEKDVQIRIGYCPENPQFPPNLKVVELMRFHSSLVNERILTPGTRIDWLLSQLDLVAYRKTQIRALSRGSVQRVALALALLGRPKLLILDEPLTALDPVSRNSVLGILGDQKLSGTSMIISSHILSDLEGIADKLGIMGNGVLEREIDLAGGELDGGGEMEIRVPLESGKQILLDEPDLAVVEEEGSLCFSDLDSEKAQDLVRRWSASGIPILGVQKGKAPLEQDILASLMENPAAGEAAKREKGEKIPV